MESTPTPPPTPTTASEPAPAPKKKSGILKWVLIVLLLIIVGGAVVLYLNLNGIIRSNVEKQASASLNVPTSLSSVNLGLFSGTLNLHQLDVGSPEGFAAPQMVSLGNADVEVSYGQLRKDPVTIKSIRLDAPKLVIEQKGGKFNSQALMNQESKPAPDGGEPLKLIINQLTITNAEVDLRPGIPGVAESIKIPIPAVDMQGIGTGDGNQNGAAIKDVLMKVITALTSKAADSDKVPEQVRALLKMDVNEIAGQLGGMVNKEVGDLTGKAKEQLKDQMKNLPPAATQGIGGVLDKATSTATSKPGDAAGDAAKKLLGGLGKKK